MTRLVLALLLLAGTAAEAADAGPWWAVAEGVAEGKSYYSAYGAAWNYASKEAAVEAALRECRKRGKCQAYRSGKNSCFLIAYSEVPIRSTGEVIAGYRTEGPIHSRAEAKETAKRIARTKFAGESVRIEVVKCSGAVAD